MSKNIKEQAREMLGIKNENDVPKWLDPIIDLAIADYQTNYEQKHIASAIEVERKRVVDRILNNMKPYTIKTKDNCRIADLTIEQFKDIVKSNEFWCEDEPFNQ